LFSNPSEDIFIRNLQINVQCMSCNSYKDISEIELDKGVENSVMIWTRDTGVKCEHVSSVLLSETANIEH